jgi:flagellar basal body-associated protein FliL
MEASNEPTTTVSSGKKRARQLRAIAFVILLLGVVGGGVTYWMAPSPVDLSDDVATANTSKKVQRDIELQVGKMGLFTSDLIDDLQDPATRAEIIIGMAILVAAGCFYFARLLEYDDDEIVKTDSPPG